MQAEGGEAGRCDWAYRECAHLFVQLPCAQGHPPPVLLTLAYGYTHHTSWFHVTQSAMGSSDHVIM